ncbi:STAS domain-containing protein [Dactylosporangium sp. CS-033363]|uniref:STAS domain-containing protein n=1 Tax=Dactylosporangium sp. CS-033363 TaxID=3239935 RepID=UPI003D921CC9
MTVSDQRDSAMLQITVAGEPGGVTVVCVHGEVDYDTAGDLRAALFGAIERRPPGVVVDLSRLRFLDSTGLGVIVSGWQRARRSGMHYALRSVPGVIAEQFELTGLATLLTFEEDTSAA